MNDEKTMSTQVVLEDGTMPEAESAPKKGIGVSTELQSELDALLMDLDGLDLVNPNDGASPVVRLDTKTLDAKLESSKRVERPTRPAKRQPPAIFPSAARKPAEQETGIEEEEFDLSDEDFLAGLGSDATAPAELTDRPEMKPPVMEDATPFKRKVAQLEEELEAIKTELDEVTTKAKRAAADFTNYRTRLQREKEDSAKFANEKLLKALLPVLDNFELALHHSGANVEQVVQGVKMVQTLMLQTIGRFGMEAFDALNLPFDPRVHQAMTYQPSTEVATGSVAQEGQKGYTLHGRLLRPALVSVSSGPGPDGAAAQPDPADESSDFAELAEADIDAVAEESHSFVAPEADEQSVPFENEVIEDSASFADQDEVFAELDDDDLVEIEDEDSEEESPKAD